MIAHDHLTFLKTIEMIHDHHDDFFRTLIYKGKYFAFSFSRIFHIVIQILLVNSIPNCLCKPSLYFHTSHFRLIVFLHSNIDKINQGIGYEFMIMTGTFFYIIFGIIASLFVNWQLTLIMLVIMPLVIGASLIFSKVNSTNLK
jgi:ABC-type multidrug transport system fused ATPase/permease subunit